MGLTQTSIASAAGVWSLVGALAWLAISPAAASRVVTASRGRLRRVCAKAPCATRRPVALIADRIADLVVLGLIGSTHLGGPL